MSARSSNTSRKLRRRSWTRRIGREVDAGTGPGLRLMSAAGRPAVGAIIPPVMPLWHEITDRWPAVLVLWHDQLLRLEGTRERSLLRRSQLPDQRKSRNWHPEILSKHAALQPTRSFALSRASKSASYNFH